MTVLLFANWYIIQFDIDLHMGLMLDALERTQEEYDALYKQAGYERVGSHFLAGGAHPLYVQEIKAKQ